MDTGALVDRIHQSLREAILAGDHAPGARLKLSALACDLGVSTTPVREAISRLEKVGLVDVVPYVGPKVRAATPAEAADLFDVRIALEGLAARLAAERATPEHLARMAATIQHLETAYDDADADAVTRADRAFHDILVEASGNSALLEMLPELSDRTTLLLEMRPETRNMPAGRPGAIEQRRRILQALRDGDADAVVAELTRSLEAGRRHLLGRLATPTD